MDFKNMIHQAIYWFRGDCRLEDNPLLNSALQECIELLPVYIEKEQYHQDTAWGFPRQGRHAQAFKAQLTASLREELERRGSVLWLAAGEPVTLLIEWCQQLNIQHVYTEHIAAEEEEREIRALEKVGIKVRTQFQSTMIGVDAVNDMIAHFPMSFTRYRQKIEAQHLRYTPPVSLANPLIKNCQAWHDSSHATYILDADLTYQCDRRTSLPLQEGCWITKEQLVHQYILTEYFEGHHAHHYKSTRNQLSGVHYSSKWSPWLAHGLISARTLMRHVEQSEENFGANESTYWLWFELLWRDYFRYLFYQRRNCLFRDSGLISEKTRPPVFDGEVFHRWSQGLTGVDLIDAAMRELKSTGYLSNRLRQVVASFWLYHYHGDWRVGAAWFESQLIDYDVYSNYGNWLYIAGKGTDPRGGRIFNIEKQCQQYDPQGEYRQLWL